MAHKNILCAVDSSDEAHQVIRVAKQVAQQNDAALTLVTVLKPIAHAYGGLDLAVLGQNSIAFEEEALAKAREHIIALSNAYSLDCDTKAVLGIPAQEIRGIADQVNADLIIMGSHGRHGLGRLLGSTANGVLHGVPCDALIVRIKDEEPPA